MKPARFGLGDSENIYIDFLLCNFSGGCITNICCAGYNPPCALHTASIFGAMFAPKPFEVAGEMVRVTKKGGRIVIGNWTPGDPSFISQVLRISADFTPPPEEGFVSPMTWGIEQHIHERFAKAGVAAEKITLKKEPYNFIAPHTSPEAFIDIFRQYYGHNINAFAR